MDIIQDFKNNSIEFFTFQAIYSDTTFDNEIESNNIFMQQGNVVINVVKGYFLIEDYCYSSEKNISILENDIFLEGCEKNNDCRFLIHYRPSNYKLKNNLTKEQWNIFCNIIYDETQRGFYRIDQYNCKHKIFIYDNLNDENKICFIHIMDTEKELLQFYDIDLEKVKDFLE